VRRGLSVVLLLALWLSIGSGGPSATAQVGPRLRVVVEANLVTVNGLGADPAGLVVVRDDVVVASGIPREVGAGYVVFGLDWRAAPRRVRPGDVVRFRGTEPAVEAIVPEVSADIDEATGRILGAGPPNGDVAVEAWYHTSAGTPGRYEGRFHTGNDGRVELALPGAALAPGDHGVVRWTDGSGHEYEVPVAVFVGTLTVGEPWFVVATSVGQALRVEETPPGGGSTSARDLVTGGSSDEVRPHLTLVALDAPAGTGTSIALTRERPLLGRVSRTSLEVPDVWVRPDRLVDRVTVGAPAGTAVRITLRAPGGAVNEVRATTGPDGRLALDFAGTADIDRGWRAEIEADVGDGWSVRATSVVGLVHVELDAGIVRGDTAPGVAVIVTVLDDNGGVLHRWDTDAGRDGTFGVRMTVTGDRTSGELVNLSPGTVLGVDLVGGGDPTVFTVPEIAVWPDVDREVVAGVGPPGHQLIVEVRGAAGSASRSPATIVGADGRYEVPVGTLTDLEPGDYGRVIVTRRDGHEWSTSWVAHRLTVELGSGVLWVDAAANRAASIRLLDADGAGRAAAIWRTSADTGWSRRVTERVQLVDRLERAVAPVAGDTIVGDVGAGKFQIVVPRLQAVAHLGHDVISGNTDAAAVGESLELEVRDADMGRASRRIPVAPDGSFEFDLTTASGNESPFDLRYNADVVVRLTRRGARFVRDVTVPGLTLDLTGPHLAGSVAPGGAGSVSWSRAGQELGRAPVEAGAEGAFDVALRHEDGTRFGLQPGDDLALAGPGLGVADDVHLTVPHLDLELDPAANAVRGVAERAAGTRFSLRTRRLNTVPGTLGAASWDAAVSWLDAERFALDFDEHPRDDGAGGQAVFMLVSGAVVEAGVRLSSGHRVIRWRLLPMLHVQHGADLVCGSAEPDAAVRVDVRAAAGAAATRADTTSGPDGRFLVRLAGGSGQALRIAERMEITASVADHVVPLVVPPFEAEMDWSTLQLSLRGIPLATYNVKYPGDAWSCWGDTGPGGATAGNASITEQHADAAGNLSHDASYLLDRGATPARGVMVETVEPNLQRVFTYLFGMQLEVHLGTDLVQGRASPWRDVTLRAVDARDRPLGHATGITAGDGRFSVRLVPDGTGPVRLERGYALEVESVGDTVELDLPLLNFDVDSVSGIVGTTAANTEVALALTLDDGRRFGTRAIADRGGRFAFAPGDVPRGEDWGLGDVTEVRAALTAARWHVVVRDTSDLPGALPTPSATTAPAGGMAIHLPATYSG
jgi:hypothetical protein